jgi:hypothetical protein
MEHISIDVREELKGNGKAKVSRKEWAVLFFMCAVTFATTAYFLIV